METEQSRNYYVLKDAILTRYDINEEAYHQHFWAVSKKGEETYHELATRVTELAQKWTRECTTKQEVLEVVATEQLLNTMLKEVRVWVCETQDGYRSRSACGGLCASTQEWDNHSTQPCGKPATVSSGAEVMPHL